MSPVERKQRALLAGKDSETLRALGVKGDRKPPKSSPPPASITWLIQIGDDPVIVVPCGMDEDNWYESKMQDVADGVT